MTKIDKKDTRKDEKSSRIYIDDDDEPSAARMSASVAPKLSKPGPNPDDVKLKDIIEKAKENDPNKDKYKAAAAATEAKYMRLFPESPITAPQKPVMPVEEKHTDEDGLRIFIFVGVLAGFVILLSFFGGPYSPLTLLGSTLNPNATAKPMDPVVIPQPPVVDNNTTPEANISIEVQPPIAPAEEVKTSIVISNWKMEPSVVKAKVGENVTIQFVASEMQFDISIDGFDVKEHVEPGTPVSITITPTSVGPYNIHAMTWSAGRTVEATGVLLVE
jgi:hypothetical protein